MAFQIDGVDVEDVTIDGVPVDEVQIDGTTVWERQTNLSGVVRYTGNGGTQQLNYGVNLQTTEYLALFINNLITTNSTNWGHMSSETSLSRISRIDSGFQQETAGSITAETTTGLTLGGSTELNTAGRDTVAVCFFDIAGEIENIIYTGNGGSQNVPHSLGVVPKAMISNRVNATGGAWYFCPDLTQTLIMSLQLPTTLEAGFTTNTDTQIALAFGNALNQNAIDYQMTLFAGDNVDSGTYTGNGSSQDIALSIEANYLLLAPFQNNSNADVYHSHRIIGWDNTNAPNFDEWNAGSDTAASKGITPTATGFTVNNDFNMNQSGVTYGYLAVK